MKKKLLAAALAAAASLQGGVALAQTGTDPAPGMQMHVNGTQLYLSGDVGWLDGYALQNLLDRLKAEGVTIDTLVMRNSRGGALNAGYDIGTIARNLGLKTIVSGYCISACSTMFVGGVERAFAGDQPLWRQYLGLHGAHTSSGLADDATQQGIYHWFLDNIAGGDPSLTDDALLQNAFLHMKDGQALAYVYDPASGADPSVYWCDSGDQAYADCLKYPQDDAYSLRLVTQQDHAATNDTLQVTSAVSGNINPNYYNPWDPTNGSYASTSPVPGWPGYVYLYFNDAAFSLKDSYGVLRVTGAGHWTLGTDDQGAPVRAAADSLWISDGGRLTLEGGIVNIKDNYVTAGGTVEGSGQFGQMDEWTYLMATSGGLVHPTGAGIDLTGEVVLYDDATLALDVNAGHTGEPSLRIGLNYTDADGAEMGALLAYPKANLALHVNPGFYRPGDDYALIGLTAETAQIREAVGDAVPASFFDFLYGGFQRMQRAGADGQLLGDGYTIDPTRGDFQPFSDSLISYRLEQQGDGVWLHVNDPFASTALCSGGDCSFGRHLGALAQSGSTHWQPMLAALEFSTVAQAHAAASQLRGDAYATWRGTRYHLVDDFGQALDGHLRAADPQVEQAVGVAMATASSGLTGPDINLPNVLRYITAPGDASGNLTAAGTRGFWGRVFGGHGHQDGSTDVAGLSDDRQGVMLGLDRRYDNGLLLGGALGYGKQTARSGSAFHGRSHALDVRLYASRTGERHYVDANLAYTHLRSSASRSVSLPLYADTAHASFGENVTSFAFEHGWTLRSDRGMVWQPILPRIDLAWLPSVQARETGASAIGLDLHAKRLFTSRAGAGLQAYRSFTTAHGTEITPHGRVLVQHRFDANEQRAFAGFDGESGQFLVTGPGEGPNRVQADLGISARSGRLALMADYVASLSSHRRDEGVLLGLRYRW